MLIILHTNSPVRDTYEHIYRFAPSTAHEYPIRKLVLKSSSWKSPSSRWIIRYWLLVISKAVWHISSMLWQMIGCCKTSSLRISGILIIKRLLPAERQSGARCHIHSSSRKRSGRGRIITIASRALMAPKASQAIWPLLLSWANSRLRTYYAYLLYY